MTIQRAAVVLLAVPVVAWAVITYRDAALVAPVQKLAIAAHPTHAQLEGALHDLKTSRTLNPDRTEAPALRAAVHIRLGDFPAARDDLQEALRREPDNALLWAQLAAVTQEIDPALSARALARERRLDPLDFRSVR